METNFIGLNGNKGDRDIENFFYEICIENNLPIIDNRRRMERRCVVTNYGSFIQLVLSNLSVSDLVVLAGIIHTVFKRFKEKDSKFLTLKESIILHKDDSVEELEAKLRLLKELELIENTRRAK
ncbi:hypothetical protein ACN077_03180 [Clostridium chromiireducens]|uniref:hypothetical protein n=1 Tax=Clostridium chromiireducens TaxID=225345 RepID=UPI003AF6456D